MTSIVPSVSRCVVALLGILFLAGGTADAQSGQAAAPPTAGERWRISQAVSLTSEFDDNVFRLSANRKKDVAAPSAGDAASGRFARMESASDVIATLAAALEVKGPGFFGRTATVAPFLDYEMYGRNTERSNVTLGLALEQSLPHEGRVRLHGAFTPGYFAKNYLLDAVDRNANGSIAAAERVYAPGEYRKSEIGLDYRHRLVDATRQHPLGAWLLLGVGYRDRAFSAPHAGRDLSGPTATAKLRLELNRRVDAEGSYDVAFLAGAPVPQVLLLDEAPLGQDFNRNGRIADRNVRVLATVDRSRTQHVLGGAVRVELSRATNVRLTYDHRWRGYSSVEPLDVSYNGRRDWRDRVGAELALRLSRAFRLKVGGRYSNQRLNRESDAGGLGEIDDYTRYQAHIGLSFER